MHSGPCFSAERRRDAIEYVLHMSLHLTRMRNGSILYCVHAVLLGQNFAV